jgi:hypothetical protein
MMTLDALCSAVPSEMVPTIAKKETTKEAWDVITTMRVGDDHVRKPTMHHLRAFRCIVYVRNTTPHLKKLEDRGRKMIFISYESGSKAYRTHDPITKHVYVTCDVVFEKLSGPFFGLIMMSH